MAESKRFNNGLNIDLSIKLSYFLKKKKQQKA